MHFILHFTLQFTFIWTNQISFKLCAFRPHRNDICDATTEHYRLQTLQKSYFV